MRRTNRSPYEVRSPAPDALAAINQAVQAGRAYMRAQLAATAHGLSMHPLQQALQEYPEQAEWHRRIHALSGASGPGQTVQMWARVGHAPPVAPAPRRGVASHILPA